MTPDLALLAVATAGYAAALGVGWRSARSGLTATTPWVLTVTAGALVLQVAAFLLRAQRAGHLPIYTAHEFSAAFAGSAAFFYLVVEHRSGRRSLCLYVLPIVLGLLLYAWMLPTALEPVIPIFRSLWLKVHIVTAFVAYAAFAVTAGACLLYLIGSRGAGSSDDLAYRAASVGFPFMTATIIAGAIWADYVWGRFWSWDPKETWSLITWLIYAAYLHARTSTGWRGRKAAVLGVVGFAAVLVTYVGVDLAVARQHDFLLWQRR